MDSTSRKCLLGNRLTAPDRMTHCQSTYWIGYSVERTSFESFLPISPNSLRDDENITMESYNWPIKKAGVIAAMWSKLSSFTMFLFWFRTVMFRIRYFFVPIHLCMPIHISHHHLSVPFTFVQVIRVLFFLMRKVRTGETSSLVENSAELCAKLVFNI